MKSSLSDRNNCFDALRLILASLVLYSHGYAIGGFGWSPFFTGTTARMNLGVVAVLGFFGLSGLLVSASYDRSNGFYDFFKKRIARIFPAFWACLLLTAFIFAPLICILRSNQSLSSFSFFGQFSAGSYFIGNFLLEMRQMTIAGVLDTAAYSKSINGSLWTLAPEFRCYMATFFLGIVGCFSGLRSVLCILFAMFYGMYVLLLLSLGDAVEIDIRCTLLAMYLSYLTGMLMYSFNGFALPMKPVAILSVLTIVLTFWLGGGAFVAPFVIPLAVISIGRSFVVHVKNDYSYGVYIYGFIVQQVLACFAFTKPQLWLYLLLSLIASLIMGALSWHLVELPALRLVRKDR